MESLSLAANEEAISIQPAFVSHLDIPNVVMVPIADAGATWDLFVVWQQNQITQPVADLVERTKSEDSTNMRSFENFVFGLVYWRIR